MAIGRKKLGQYLLRWGTITEEKLGEALKAAQASGKRIGEQLVEMGYATEDDIARALAQQFEMEYVDVEAAQSVQAATLDLIPEEIIRKFTVLPLSKKGNKLKVLIHDPMDLSIQDTLRYRLNCDIETAIGSKTKIKAYIDKTLANADDAMEVITRDGKDMAPGEAELTGSEADADQAPIIRFVSKIIAEAVNSRASDIHIEPMGNRVRLRYRVDGVCYERDNIPKRMQSAIITRIKIMAGMKIDIRRVPQDGRIKMRIGDSTVDFRCAVCPSYHGESVVMRILRPDSVRIGLLNLGFEPDTLDLFNKTIRKPNGIFLVTGPTGSGKTTTLYTALDVLNRPDRKIITAEDPVEYNFTGINQCQVRDDIGLSFATILRSMLRQAPNIILVGEIRDKEVAEVAIQAALTGHLVFSTLHTNDAPSAITRLIDMGVKPFLVASSLQAIMAQRLIRVLCKKCKQPDEKPNQFFLRLIGIKPTDMVGKTIFKSVGCQDCGMSGYRGRRAIYEYMPLNSEIRELAFKRAPAAQLRIAARAMGMRGLVGDGRLKVRAGVTTPEEIARVAQVEGIVSMGADEDAAV